MIRMVGFTNILLLLNISEHNSDQYVSGQVVNLGEVLALRLILFAA